MGYFQMTRNVEEIFGGVVTAPHQIPYTYTSVNGGETFLSLPFYPITGFVTIGGSVQVPLENFEMDGNTLYLGTALDPGDVVFCLFDKVISPQDTQSGVRIYKFFTVGGETEFTPDFTAYGVQTLFVDGKYKIPGVDYTYNSVNGVVTMTAPLPSGVWVSAEMTVKQNNYVSDLQNQLNDLYLPTGWDKIGKVSSYSSLRSIIPTKLGQVIELLSYYEGWAALSNPPEGGGNFVSVTGTGVEDGGHICVPTGASYYWVRVTDKVKLTDYGVKTFSWNAGNVTVANDQSDKVNAACKRAVVTGYPLVAPPASYNNSLRGIPVLKTVDISQVRSIQGDMLLFANNLLGSYSEVQGVTVSTGVSQKFVLINMNADFDPVNGGYTFSSVKGPRSYGVIRAINLGDRSTMLNGQLHFVASSTFDGVFSDGFNGWGNHWGISQDTVVKHQSASRCGNKNQFAIFAYSYPRATTSQSDFCNNLTFNSIICEYSFERSIFLAGPDVRYDRVHEEGTHVTGEAPDAWGVYSIDQYAAGIGSGIANCAFALNNGSGGQLNVIDLDGTNTTNLNLVLNMAHTDFGIVQATRSSTDKTWLTNTIVAAGWAGDGGNIADIRTDILHTQDTASVINKVSAGTANIRSPSIQIMGASIAKLNLYSGTVSGYVGSSSGWANLGGSTYTARLVNSTILNGPIYVDTSSSADVVIDNCLIASSITRGRYDGSTVTATGTRATKINNCVFPNALDLPSAGALVEFSNCSFSNLVLGTGTYYQIHKGSRITTITKNAAAWGLWAFDDSTVVQALSGTWAWPDTAYNNYNLRVYNPITGRSRKYTTYGWIDYNGPSTQTTLTFTGVATKTLASQVVAVADTLITDAISVIYTGNTNGLLVWGQVTTNGSVTVYVFNPTASSLDLSGTFKIKVV